MRKRRMASLSLLSLLFSCTIFLLLLPVLRPAGAQSEQPTWLPLIASHLLPLADASARQISAGSGHVCALLEDREVRCWGNNTLGQLGDESRITANLPRKSILLNTIWPYIDAVAAGSNHTCVLLTNGAVACWGENAFGTLGGGDNSESLNLVLVNGMPEASTAIRGGDRYTCVITVSGGVYCWGKNEYGQIGDGTQIDRFAPVAVQGLASGVQQLSTATDHTCALLEADGSIQCWGENGVGQLGTGTTERSLVPTAVAGLDVRVQAIDSAGSHTCALTVEGAVYCWGSNQYRQLGVRGIVSSTVPIPIPELQSEVTQIAIGPGHGCALTVAGAVICWGYGNWQFAAAEAIEAEAHPQVISGLERGVRAIAAGGFSTCVILDTGAVKCWGENNGGQLGDGTWTSSSLPVQVASLVGK